MKCVAGFVAGCICGQAWCTQVCRDSARGPPTLHRRGWRQRKLSCCQCTVVQLFNSSLPACLQLKTMTPDQRAAAERAQQVALRLLASGPQASSLQQPSMSMAMPSAPTNINPVVAAAQAAAMAVAQKVHCLCLTPCLPWAASTAQLGSTPVLPCTQQPVSFCLLACDR